MLRRESFHERFVEDNHVKFPSERSFGLVLAAVFALICVWAAWHGSVFSIAWFAASAAILMLALVRPSLLAQANRLWTRCGLLLGRIVNPIIMLVLFAAVFTPVAVFRRLVGADPLRLAAKPENNSYWISRSPPGPAPWRMTRQF